jgi:hypothetical protein
MVHTLIHADLTTLAKNDPLPMFSTLNLDDALLLTKDYLYYIDDESADRKHDRFGIFLSPFAQSADRGKTIRGTDACPPPPIEPCDPTLTDTPLGDLTGRTSMLALLFGAFPAGVDFYPGGENGFLETAFSNIFCTDPDDPDTCFETAGQLNNEKYIDPDQKFGYFSFPLKYRKRGLRLELVARVYKNFGVRLQTGFSSIRQVREATRDLTDEDTFEGLSGAKVEEFLMDQLDNIASEIGINLCNFIETSMEEVRFNVFWRQGFEINKEAEQDWARFLLIPYFQVSGSASPGKRQDPFMLFALPFGNNTHPSVGLTGGINFNFLETIEIGGEVGYTHFFSKSQCMPIPNSKFQTNLFPFSTNVSIQPGDSWYFGARLAAYHFIDKLSMYFEWFVLDHQEDHICLKNPDPAFLPEVLECTTSFKVKLGNAGFNYDLSPNIGVGFLWQIPFSQRNAYRSSTLMGGFNVTF